MKVPTLLLPHEAGPGRYRIDCERGLRIEEYQGKVRLGDWRALVSAVWSDPCWSSEFHELIDFSEAELELSANDVLRLALWLRQGGNRGRGWQVFAVRDSAAYGVVRMLGYWSRNTGRSRIFQSRLEAEVWLERHRDRTPPAFVDQREEPRIVALRDAI